MNRPLFAIHPTRQVPIPGTERTRNATQPVRDWQHAQQLNADGWNIYQHVNAGIVDAHTGRLTLQSLTHLCSHQVDIDPPEWVAPGSPEYEQWISDTVAALMDGIWAASRIMRSGRGLQAFWDYAEPIQFANDHQRADMVNRALRYKFHGDEGAVDLARIMKVHGLTAWPNEAKAAAGWQAAPARLVSGCQGVILDRVSFENWATAGVPPEAMQPPVKAAIELTDDTAADGYTGPDDDAQLVAQMIGDPLSTDPQVHLMRALLQTGDLQVLGQRWPDAKRAYDASAADMALANHLAYFTGCNPARIERMMRASPMARPKWDQHRTYLADCIAKAIGDRVERLDYLGGKAQAVADLQSRIMKEPQNFDQFLPEIAAMSKRDRDRLLQEVMQTVKTATGIGIGAIRDRVKEAVADLRRQQRAGYVLSKDGDILPNAANLAHRFTVSQEWAGVFAYDDFSKALWINRPYPSALPNPRGYPRPMEDADVGQIQIAMQRDEFSVIAKEPVLTAMQSAGLQNRFHALQRYLNGLHWDGTSRIDRFLTDFIVCHHDSPQHLATIREMGRRFLIRAVARAMEPGVKADDVLCIGGPQGIRKSSAISALCPFDDWFLETMPSLTSDKDAMDALRGNWIIEIAEMKSLQGASAEATKRFLSSKIDKFRPAYGRVQEAFKRQCVFAGTFNGDTPLSDPTGNRRWHIVFAVSCDPELIAQWRDQLWAEAVVAYRAGARHWFDDREKDDAPHLIELERAAEGARYVSVQEAVIADHLRFCDDVVSVHDVADKLFGRNNSDPSLTRKINDAARKVGWDTYRTNNVPKLRRGPNAAPKEAVGDMVPGGPVKAAVKMPAPNSYH